MRENVTFYDPTWGKFIFCRRARDIMYCRHVVSFMKFEVCVAIVKLAYTITQGHGFTCTTWGEKEGKSLQLCGDFFYESLMMLNGNEILRESFNSRPSSPAWRETERWSFNWIFWLKFVIKILLWWKLLLHSLLCN